MEKNSVWVCAWGDTSQSVDIESILLYVEINRIRLREKYTTFIYDLGQTMVNGSSFEEHFEIKKCISLWSMSLLEEKSPFKSSTAIDCLKIFALEEILVNRKLIDIEIVGINSINAKNVINQLCNQLSVKVRFTSEVTNPEIKSIFNTILRNNVPYEARALLTLIRTIFSRWRLRAGKMKKWFSDKDSIFFMSYFINLEECAFQKGQFNSHHWGKLPEILSNSGKHLNWLHRFLISESVPSTSIGLKWLNIFNENSKQMSKHSFLESYLTCHGVLRIFCKWLELVYRSYKLSNVSEQFTPQDSVVNVWLLCKKDWYESFRGSVAMQNLLLYELFDQAMAHLPKQYCGLYLYEGQLWEPAFIHAWRKHGHGKLIGVAHSTIRFWDLRFFNDTRYYNNQNITSFRLPDKIAINSPVSRKTLIDGNCPEEFLVDTEALRYLHFSNLTHVLDKITTHEFNHKKIKLLVLGDIQNINTQPLFELLSSLPKEIKSKLAVTVKPHPVNYFGKTEYLELDYEINTKPLNEILSFFDVTFGGNQSSASLDSYLFGIPTIVQHSPSSLNFSPLRDTPEAKFVGNVEELVLVLNSLGDKKNKIGKASDYFFLNSKLPKWRDLLLKNDKFDKEDCLEDI